MSPGTSLQVGRMAPAFQLPAAPQGTVELKQFRDRNNVVLYFYPRDNTPGCTTEACDFRDHLATLSSSDTIVLGVSTDSVESHRKFADRYSLPFPLLADTDHAVCEKYGVWVEKNRYGKKSFGVQRATFLIDKSGRIARIWPRVRVKGHAAEVLQAVRELEQTAGR